MPRFAANLSFMFNEVPFLDRFAAAAAAGFRGVEYLFPYEHTPEVMAATLKSAGVENVLFNMPAGDWAKGERGIAALPGREEEFRQGVAKALEYARVMGVTRLHAMAGIVPPGGPDAASCQKTYSANIKYAAAETAKANITLLIEPINTRDMPGFFLNQQAQAAEVLAEVGAPNLKMQMDCYHMQIMEGDLAVKLKAYADRCAHIQVAGVPERNEPNTGEINYGYIFKLLDDIGYQGWIGCEYKPAAGTVAGLGWFEAWKK
jgi:hydroxypyruvate isomerase